MKILAIGCNSVANTFNSPYKDWEIEKFLYHSVFALCQENNEESMAFKKLISNTDASYLVLDLYSLSLFVNVTEDKMLHSRSVQLPQDVKTENRAFFENEAECLKCIDAFVSIINEKFDASHIILVKTKRGEKYCKGKLVRAVSGANETAFNARLGRYEDYFVSKTGSRTIDVFGSYFIDAYHMFGWSLVNYESFAYDNIKHCLTHIFENTSQDNTLYIKLLRYIKYGDFLERAFRLNWLFSSEDIVEDFISHTSVSFVKEFYEELIKLDQKNIKTLSALKKEALKNCSDKVALVASWYAALKETKFDGLVFDRLITDYKLTLASKLANYCNYLLGKKKINGHTATAQNLESYIPYLTSGKISELSKTPLPNQPIMIDVWGSCISREIFKFIEDNVVLGSYIYRASGLHINDPPINIPLSEFENLDNFNGSKWRSEFIKNNLYRETPKKLKGTKSKWLLMDLYDFAELTYQIDGNSFVLDYDTTNMPIYQKLCQSYGLKCVGFYPYKDEDLASRLDTLVDLIKSVYGENVILTNIHFSMHYISDSGEIVKFNRNKGEFDSKNEYLKKCQDYLAEKLNCYVIDFNDMFIADERFVWGESPVHYETLFFTLAASTISDIINGKSSERVISTVPEKLSAERILGFLMRIKRYGGKNAPKYYETLSNSLDKNIISLYNSFEYDME